MLEDIPLSPEAQALFKRLQPRIEERLNEVNRTPVSILLWGPGLTAKCPLSICRMGLRRSSDNMDTQLFSEELCTTKDNLRLQQLIQAQEVDLIVSMPGTPGSIGEIHDFTADRRVNAKTLVFLNEEYLDGYSAQSIEAISTIVSCKVHYYPNLSCLDIIDSFTINEVQKIRELKYILNERY